MKIALYGATGNIGQQILAEALQRGHDVTAIVRDPTRLTVSHENLTVVTGDITDVAGVAGAVAGHDAVIGSISGRRDGDPNKIVVAGKSLLAGTAQAKGPRVLWVGGAGSLEIAPGVRLLDSPDFPDAYKAEATAGAEVLSLFRAAPAEVAWTYFSPAAEIGPGERTGVFRVDGDQLLVDGEGRSRISIADYAVALLDEIETPKHINQRFTAAY